MAHWEGGPPGSPWQSGTGLWSHVFCRVMWVKQRMALWNKQSLRFDFCSKQRQNKAGCDSGRETDYMEEDGTLGGLGIRNAIVNLDCMGRFACVLSEPYHALPQLCSVSQGPPTQTSLLTGFGVGLANGRKLRELGQENHWLCLLCRSWPCWCPRCRSSSHPQV